MCAHNRNTKNVFLIILVSWTTSQWLHTRENKEEKIQTPHTLVYLPMFSFHTHKKKEYSRYGITLIYNFIWFVALLDFGKFWIFISQLTNRKRLSWNHLTDVEQFAVSTKTNLLLFFLFSRLNVICVDLENRVVIFRSFFRLVLMSSTSRMRELERFIYKVIIVTYFLSSFFVHS